MTDRETVAFIAGQRDMRDRLIVMFAQWELEAAMHGTYGAKRGLREMQTVVAEMELRQPPAEDDSVAPPSAAEQ